jgi:hypothetical protein
VEILFKQVLGVALAAAFVALPAAAAERTSPCQGKAPALGEQVHGPVLHVADGDRLCVATSDDPARWVELTLAPPALHKASAAPAPSRGALMGVAFAQNLTCKIVGQAQGRPLAACARDGQDVAMLARSPQAAKISHAWR